MKMIQVIGVAVLFLTLTSAAIAGVQVEFGRWDRAGGGCYDYIQLTRDDGCVKMITRDCDDSNPCGWVDHGWHQGPCGNGDVLPTGDGMILPSVFDSNDNLICPVAPGTGGVYSPQSNGVCFTANGSATFVIAASIVGGLN
ncbi:MAG TPA: hypothetical protein VHI13_00435 [Candidatus Kapabacteria bacterium]|nr:hypothetical protein [Candidatus Kapabacteria bacterium]